MARKRPIEETATAETDFFKNIFQNQMDMFDRGVEFIIDKKLKNVSKDFTKNKAFNSIFEAVGKVSKGVFSASSRGEALASAGNLDFIEKEFKRLSASGEIDEKQLKYLQSISKELKVSNKRQLKSEHSMGAIVKRRLKEKIPSITGILAAVGLDNPAFLFAGGLVEDLMKARKESKEKGATELQPYKEERVQNTLEDRGYLGGKRIIGPLGPEGYKSPEEEAFSPFVEKTKKDTQDADALVQSNDLQAAYEKLISAMISLTENTVASSDVYQESVKAYKEALDEILSLGGASPELRGQVQAGAGSIEGGTPESAAEFAKMNEEIFKLIAINELHLPSMDKNIEALTRESSASKFAEIERMREAKIENEQLLDALDNLDNPAPVMSTEGKKGGFFGKIFDSIGGIGAFLGFLTGGGLAAIGTAMSGAMAALLPMIPAILGVLAAVTIIATGLYGAFQGWNNAAENLGKEADKITTSDKIASAIGGFYGKIWSMVDWVGEQFGFDFGLEELLTKDFSKFLAGKFDLIKDIFKFVFVTAPTKITESLKAAYNWFVELPGKIEEKVQEWIDAIPSFSELGAMALEKIKEWTSNIFTFEFPEIDFGFTDFINETYNKIVEWFEELFSIENLKKKVGNAISETGNVVYAKFNAAKEGVSSAYDKSKELAGKASDFLTGKKPEPAPAISMMEQPSTSDKLYPEQESVVITSGKPPRRKGVFAGTDPLDIGPGVYPLPLVTDKASAINDTKTNMVVQDSITKEKENQRASSAIINAPRTTNNVNNSTAQNTQITQGLSPREMDNTFRHVQYQYR